MGFPIEGKGYIGTGWDGTVRKDFWAYNPAANIWTRKADFKGTARSWAIGFSIGGKGYIGTGWDGSTKIKDFWEYTPDATDVETTSQTGGFYIIPNKKGGAAVIYLE